METAYDGRQVVGMDLHRRRSVLVRMTEDGRRLGTARITNSPAALRQVIAKAGRSPRVVLEGTYGWYWAADTLAAAGAEVHLAHPLGVRAFTYRRVKNDPLTEHSDVSAGHRLGGSLPLRPLTCAGPYLRGHKGVRAGCATTGSGNTASYRPPAFSSLPLVTPARNGLVAVQTVLDLLMRIAYAVDGHVHCGSRISCLLAADYYFLLTRIVKAWSSRGVRLRAPWAQPFGLSGRRRGPSWPGTPGSGGCGKASPAPAGVGLPSARRPAPSRGGRGRTRRPGGRVAGRPPGRSWCAARRKAG